MASHHFIGTGPYSDELARAAGEPRRLLDQVAAQVAEVGFEVVADNVVEFPGGGLTLVWVLAESHLVLHYWGAEGFATIDLHICDYVDSNAAKARRLLANLEASCFLPGTADWQEISVAEPRLPGPRVPARLVG
jgi:S-adenosylmethionine/arginine decarboxylase-like enzyme